jgi:hypothetical protein
VGDRLERAQIRAFKRARAAMEEEEETNNDDAAKAAALRARLESPLAMWFAPARERDVTRQARLVEECLDDMRARAARRGGAPLALHWRASLPAGILASAAMQQYLRRWAAADAAAADAALVDA